MINVSWLHATVVCALVVLSYVDDGLADGDNAVDNGHEACSNGVNHTVEARCDGAHCCGCGWLFVWVGVVVLVGWKCPGNCGLLWSGVCGEWREEKEGQRQQERSIKRFSSLLHQGMQPRVTR
jgi:hypothetical protein